MSFDCVALVASAGGGGLLRRVLGQLPPDFPAPVLCMYPPSMDTRQIQTLKETLPIRMEIASAGVRPQPGVAYFPPFGTTLVLRDDGVLSLAPFGPESENMDPEMVFLSSIARACRNGALAAILASDGRGVVAGARAIREGGGSIVAAESSNRLYAQAVTQMIGGGQWDQVVSRDELALAIKLRVMGDRLLGDRSVIDELGRMLGELVGAQPSTLGNVRLLDRETETLRLVTQRGFDAAYASRVESVGLGEQRPCAQAVRDNRRVVIADIEFDAMYRHLADEARAAGFRAMQSTPISARGIHLVGVLSTHYPRPRQISEPLAGVLDRFAADAAEVVVGPLGP